MASRLSEESGSVASAATILAGGVESVTAQGSDDGASISGGTQLDYGLASGVDIFTGSQAVETGGTAANTIVSGGVLNVLSGGLANLGNDWRRRHRDCQLRRRSERPRDRRRHGRSDERSDGVGADRIRRQWRHTRDWRQRRLFVGRNLRPDGERAGYWRDLDRPSNVASVAGAKVSAMSSELFVTVGGTVYDLTLGTAIASGTTISLTGDGHSGTDVLALDTGNVGGASTMTAYTVSTFAQLNSAIEAVDSAGSGAGAQQINIDGTIDLV